MFHFASLLLGSLVFFCSFALPAAPAADGNPPPCDIKYYDTLYANEEVPMPMEMTSTPMPYISKTQTASHKLAIRCPQYTYAPAVGCCAAIAGGNLLGYFDRFDENLIPDHKSGTPISNTFAYASQDDGVEAAIDKLYEYMTGDGYGATENDFKNGLKQYCSEKGKSISYTSCMYFGSFSYSKAKAQLDANLPIALFLSGYNVADIFTGDSKDTISYYVSSASHIMIGFGYEEYTYTTSSGTSNYTFISVASGLISNSSGLFDINFQTKINDALAVNIY